MKRTSTRVVPVTVILLLVSIAVSYGGINPSRWIGARAAEQAKQHLRGAEAVEFLKRNGMYDAVEKAGSAGAFVEQAKLTANDGAAQDSLGFSVAISGDTAIVGAPADGTGSATRHGSAYVYVRNGATWTFQQKLNASDMAANDEFGYSVAIAGNTVAVGRHNTQVGVNRTRGAVYIFTRSGTTWTQQPILTASDGVEGDIFGTSLALDGDTLIVGAQQKNNGATFFQGAAYIFTGSGGRFTEQAKLTANDGGFANFFGFSVAVSGDTAIVGATGLAGGSADGGRGAAYVFVRSGSSWSQQKKLLASDGAGGDAFGYSVGVSGDTVIVGARADVVGTAGEVGSAYIFARTGTDWTEQQKLTAAEPTPRNDFFGNSVAIKGETVVVGSPAHEVLPSIANHGAVYVFSRSGTTWSRQQKLIHSDASSDALGQAVAFDGASIIGGAPAKNSARGAAYVFAFDPEAAPKLVANDGTANDRFGFSVAISGDTAVVGAPADNITGQPGGQEQGSAYVFVRNGSAWSQQQKLVASDGAFQDAFGASVAISGDTLIVGAERGDKGTNTNEGSAYVFVRNGSTWTQQQELTGDGANVGFFGASVAIEGDTAVVGAFNENNDPDNFTEGAVYIFTRSGTTWTQQQRIPAPNPAGLANFGRSVSISGESIIVGAPGDTLELMPELSRGAAYVFTRSGSTWTQQARLIAGNQVGDNFADAVAISGDTAIVGAPFNDQGSTNSGANQGAAYVFTRNGSTWTQQQKLTASDAAVGDELGDSVAISGDTVLVGSRSDDFGTGANTILNQGSVYVFRRSGATWTEVTKLSAFDGAAHDLFGESVAISGNTVVVGSWNDTVEGKVGQGSAYVFTLGGSVTPTPTPTATPTPTPTPLPSPSPFPTPTPMPSPLGTVQFTLDTFDADEASGGANSSGFSFGEAEAWEAALAASQGAASVSVMRTDATQAASVDYATANGTASDRSDYTAAYGTLRFAPGETSKSIVIHVTNDRFQESAESFSVVLSNPVGMSLGTPSSATVNVMSDDATTGANPVKDPTFDADFFVRQHYIDFLGREADDAGLAFWTNQIEECESRPEAERQDCREVRRINVSAAFFLSIEFQQTSFLVYRFHQAAFDTGEQLQIAQFLADADDVRRGVIVGETNWEQKLEVNKQAYALAFVQRQAFYDRYPASMTPAQFVDALNANTGGALSPAERDARVAELNADNTPAGRASVLRKIADDSDFVASQSNPAFVQMQYFGYLRRNPNAAPDSNFDGYNFWLAKLNQFGGNFVQAEMVKAFITSSEYQQRFGP